MKLLIILLAICYYSIASPIVNHDLEENRLVNYLTSMKSRMDLNVKPCDNFYQYSCGTKFTGNGARRTMFAKANNHILLKETFANMGKATRAEKVVQHYYNSCLEQEGDIKLAFEQVDSIKAMGSFPVEQEPTDTNLMNLMTDLMINARFGVLMALPVLTQDNSLEAKNGIILQPLHSIFKYISKMPMYLMTEFGVPEQEQEVVQKAIVEFYSKLQEAAETRENKTVDIESIEQLTKIAPDFDWDMFMESIKSKIAVPADMLKNLKVHDPDLLKRVTTIIKNTDKKVLANFMLTRALEMGAEVDCVALLPFFRPMLYKKILDQHVDAEDTAKHMVVLDDFKTSLVAMKSALKKPEDEAVNKSIDKLIYLVTNHSMIFNDEYLDNIYKDYDLEKNMLFSNSWKLLKNAIERMLKKMHNAELVIDVDAQILMGHFDDVFNMNTHDNSILSYLITVTPHLWKRFFEENPQYEISTATTCLQQQEMELEDYEMKKYLLSYAVNKVAYTEFMMKLIYIDGAEKHAKLLEDLGFKDFRQVYFIGMAQDRCQYGEEENGVLMKTFQHMNEFQEAFNCPADSAMNKVDEMKCNLENCDQIKEDSLHIVPYTNEQCIKPTLLNNILDPKIDL